MPTRYDLAQMLAEIREDAGEPARSAHMSQDQIKAMIRKRQAAARAEQAPEPPGEDHGAQ